MKKCMSVESLKPTASLAEDNECKGIVQLSVAAFYQHHYTSTYLCGVRFCRLLWKVLWSVSAAPQLHADFSLPWVTCNRLNYLYTVNYFCLSVCLSQSCDVTCWIIIKVVGDIGYAGSSKVSNENLVSVDMENVKMTLITSSDVWWWRVRELHRVSKKNCANLSFCSLSVKYEPIST